MIWLNEENAKILDKQLKEEQHTSIQQLNRLGEEPPEEGLPRYSRMEHLKLPTVAFYQLQVEYSTVVTEQLPDTANKLGALQPDRYKTLAVQHTRELNAATGPQEKEIIYQTGRDEAAFFPWLQSIAKGSFGFLGVKDLLPYEAVLQTVFHRITYEEGGFRYFNNQYHTERIASQIRLAFRCRRDLETREDVLKRDVHLLLVEKLATVARHDKLYPSETETADTREIDAGGLTVAEHEAQQTQKVEALRQMAVAQGLADMAANLSAKQYTTAVHNKDRSFHFLPYDFRQSRFELNFLKEAMGLANLRQAGLELYYNGERSLTEFKIACYERRTKYWRYVGEYTPDFLLVQRKAGSIHKAVIIETKGNGYADQPAFVKRRQFMQGEFLRLNTEKFGYAKFDYLYLTDADGLPTCLVKLADKIQQFFTH